jgi:hypothetical protein
MLTLRVSGSSNKNADTDNLVKAVLTATGLKWTGLLYITTMISAVNVAVADV